MGEIRFETQLFRAGAPGGLSPLPELGGTLQPQKPRIYRRADNTDLYFGYGQVDQMLPYLSQEGYERTLANRPVKTVTLENEFLKAIFLPEYGGRLWQLYDKEHQRDLVYRNPVLRFGNLAIRNQWFSGGVEWNIGVIGHHPYTCDTLFAGRVAAADGENVLRLFQYERIRGVAYQLDIWLPDQSRRLYVRVRITNPNSEITPMYWWSNIAVEHIPGGRVIAPAQSAYTADPQMGGHTRLVPLVRDGFDCTRYETMQFSCDHFFDIPARSRKFIAHLGPDGKGLLQSSTGRLQGRKIFVWGEHAGGRRWQRFLTEGDHPYVEIQAGLAKTQSECLPMPPNTTWEWLETYGIVETDPEITLGGDWEQAQKNVLQQLKVQGSEDALENLLAASRDAIALRPIAEWYTHGDGWGALENERRRADGEEPLPTQLPFETGGSQQQAPWRTLLTDGVYPAGAPGEPPAPPIIGSAWRIRLEAACEKAPNWEAWYQLGILFWEEKEYEKAQTAWEHSLQAAENAWAYRNLAVLAALKNDSEKAPALYQKAAALSKNFYLCREYLRFLKQEGRWHELLDFLAQCTADVRENSLVRYLEAYACCRTGALERCEALLMEHGGMEISELREGARELSELWAALQEKKGTSDPIPPSLDFRTNFS